ncbi:membrane-bound lytic murein transglycosylase A [Sphingomonas insulae]|uniref:peptidoglycan lytic exotransglycosylase n=1 Tax=Sphingomonas insulae TaxID=424800 RepID=A0ABN1HY28_9SPHN|nr:murein transglycosylase A [Sphingomonas insulae]NIJ29711.1 membrane-bound lytic murein transglycosylase A [Sphingomonas insulae]
MTGRRTIASIALAMALGACGGRVVPLSTQAPPPRQTAGQYVRPTARPAAPGQQAAGQQIASGRTFDGQIRGATPLLAVPVPANPGATTAATAGIVPGPSVATLPFTDEQAEAARRAFLSSCPGLMRRTDASGLTRGSDWQPACSAAANVARGGARAFFASYFEAVQVADGRAFATGYYEPEIAASRERRPGYTVPIYARPNDLIDVDLGQFSDALKGKKVRGRVSGSNLIPYYDRAAIDTGVLDGKAPVLAWGADEAAVFFLQIQGSGRLRLPDGGIMRVGYDTQNGRDYTGIGALMKARGLLQPGQTSMRGIVAWLHAHPDEGRAIMAENKSFVFFRELNTPPVGAMGYVVNGGVSAAADVKYVPLGAPVFLSMDRQDASGLWVAQDTGGAIKGSNRFDTFWGAGPVAEATAGGMAARGTAFLLLPIGTLARVQGNQPVPSFETGTGAPAQP